MLAFGFNPATMQLWHEGAFVFRQKKSVEKQGCGFFSQETHKN